METRRDDAIKATRQGAIAALISAGMTAIIMAIAVATKADDEFAYLNDPWLIIDVALILVLAFFIYKKSRLAALFMFAYFVLSKIYQIAQTGSFSGGLVALAFIFFFGKAVWGSFVYHNIEKRENPDYKPTRKWVIATVGVVATLIGGLIVLGTLTVTGTLPSTVVQEVSDIKPKQLQAVKDTDFFNDDENILYMYSPDMMSAGNEATVLTDQRVVYYFTDPDDGLLGYTMDLDEITNIQEIEAGGPISDAVYQISGLDDDNWIQFVLSAEEGKNLDFMQELRKRVKESRAALLDDDATVDGGN